ncbi:hypothetical protein JCM3770_006143 [Rhodotorula araucariae]
MDPRALLGLCGLARLPEELVDLACSFVVRDSEVKDFVTTLGSLCLTSRQFVGPAQRALLYDPSRILARRPEWHPQMFLNRILRRPALGVHIKRLEYLVAIWDGAPALSFYHEDPIAFFNWAVSLVHHCPNLEAVAVWPDAAVGWVEVLQNLPRLCHLVVQCRDTEIDLENDLATAPSFLASLRLDHLRSLTLWHIGCFPRCPEPALRLPVAHLILDECDLVDDELAIDFSTVRHLTLKPNDAQAIWCPGRLAPVLESFVLTPTLALHWYGPEWPDDAWSYLFQQAPALPNLIVVVLKSVLVNLGAFEQVASVARHLQHVDLHGSAWDPDDWAASSRATFPHICRAPSLVRDSDDLASHWAVLARPPAADQVYLGASADEAPLEHGYQVGDEADEDIEGEAHEPWRL